MRKHFLGQLLSAWPIIFQNVSSLLELIRKKSKKKLKKLDVNKASQRSDIPTKIIKENIDIFGDFIGKSYNNTIKASQFYRNLKPADITPAHKKGKKDMKDNYRPVSILPNLSKIFEKLMFKEMSQFFDKIFYKYQCGFRKGFSTQQCLLAMLEKWKRAIDNGKCFGALLTDLSKAFDCLEHELLIVNLNAYGFHLSALKLIHDYLSNRKQRTKINSRYSTWHDILFGVPQGSILGPLLFNIYLIDLFFVIEDTDIASYADDNTPYLTDDTIEGVIKTLEVSKKIFKWFDDNLMKRNADQCHLLISTNETVKIKVGNYDITNSKCEKLLGVNFDHKLNFDKHLSELFKKACKKINALSRITPYMNVFKKRILLNAFFKSQFSYCPLIWMCHSRTNNNKINRLHERCLRIIFSDKQSSFETLLEKDDSVSIHNRNLQILATEMYKIKNNLSTSIIADLFEERNEQHYNLRNFAQFSLPAIRTVYNGSESISFLGPKVWNILPDNLKNASSLEVFKASIKIWKPEKCPSRICRLYVQNVGFV